MRFLENFIYTFFKRYVWFRRQLVIEKTTRPLSVKRLKITVSAIFVKPMLRAKQLLSTVPSIF